MKHELVLDYMPLAEKIARDANLRTPPNVSEDDLKSVAYMGLVDAARRFDPEKGSFGGYARTRITGEIKDHLKKVIEQDRICLSEERSERDHDPVQTRDFFEFVSTKLSDTEGDVLRMYYIEEKTLKEIGAVRGVSESRASQILGGSVKRLRKVLKG